MAVVRRSGGQEARTIYHHFWQIRSVNTISSNCNNIKSHTSNIRSISNISHRRIIRNLSILTNTKDILSREQRAPMARHE